MAELYAMMHKASIEKAKKEAEAVKDYNNPNFINLQVGKAYEMRLMYWASGVPGERIVPIIEKNVHAVKAEDGTYHEVTCPTSDYLLGRAGFRVCPICGELSKLWDEYVKGSTAAKVAYDKFKRKFKGYAVVKVINDPGAPENNGTFKILYINSLINDFLLNKIKGLDHKRIPIEGSRPIGFKAFDPSANGKNLVITVTKDGEFNKYACEFIDPEEGKGDLGVTVEMLTKAYDELEFDKYYTPYDPDALKAFYENVYLEKEISPVQEAAAEVAASIAKITTPVETTAEKAETVVKEEAKAETITKAAKPETTIETTKPSTNSSVDIDAILAGLPS